MDAEETQIATRQVTLTLPLHVAQVLAVAAGLSGVAESAIAAGAIMAGLPELECLAPYLVVQDEKTYALTIDLGPV